MHQTASARAVVVSAEDLDFDKHVHVNNVYVNQQKGFKMVKLQSSPENRCPLLLRLKNKGGRISSMFGVDVTPHGKTNLTIPVPCEKEYASLVSFQEKMIEYAKANKTSWWNYDVSNNNIEDNFASIVSVPKKKNDSDEFWPSNMKTTIPLNENGDLNNCKIVDMEGNDVSIEDLPGCSWDTVLVEFSSIYFQNRFNWGFGPKTLRLIRVSRETNSKYDPSVVDFMSLVNDEGDNQGSPAGEKQSARDSFPGGIGFSVATPGDVALSAPVLTDTGAKVDKYTAPAPKRRKKNPSV